MSTIAERVSEAITQSQVDVTEVAKACKISVQAVYKWMSGASKTIKGEYLVELARLTGHEARWIIRGVGPKKIDQKTLSVLRIMEKLPEYKKDMLVTASNSLAESEKPTNNGTQ